MSATGAEGAKAGHGRIKPSRSRGQAGKPGKTRVVRSKHSLAQIFVRRRIPYAVVGKIFLALAPLRTCKRLFGSVIDAGDPKAEELNGNARHHLMITGGVG